MKKILSILAFLLLISSTSQAQHYKPNMQLIVKGVMNVPFYDPYSDNTSTGVFSGVQIEPVVNLSRYWAAFGTFNIGFIPPKDADFTTAAGSFTFKSSTELSGWAGARYYFAPEDGRYMKVYIDAAVGVYHFSISDNVFTASSSPSYTKRFTYPSVTQMGLNIGSGLNVNLNSSLFLNFGARMHNLFSKEEVQEFTVVYSNGTQTEVTSRTQKIPNNNYLQLTAGLGFRFGL